MTTYTLMPIQMSMIMKMMILMYIMNKQHTLNNLIIIEFVSIAASVMTLKMTSCSSMQTYLMMFTLIILITESILGLSLLINMIRTHGNDYMKTTSITRF